MAGNGGGAPGPAPVLVIVGLPRATAEPAQRTINNRKGRWQAIAGAFPDNDNAVYVGPALLDLVRRVSAFSRAKPQDRKGVPVPSRLVVAYVRTPGATAIYDGFGHAAWPIALREDELEAADAPPARHWRHNIEAVNQRVAEALQQIESPPVEALRLRLEARRTGEVLLLPARNFHTGEQDRLVTRFRAFMEGDATADDVAEGIDVQRYARSRLPTFYRLTGGDKKRFAKDARGLVFARSEHGQHGAHHDALPDNADLTLLRRNLEGRFRFGTPIRPEGFQHDVQWEGDRILKEVAFDCAQAGPLLVTATHANVYPNDVVKVR